MTEPITTVTAGRIMPLEQCGAVGKCMSSPQSYREHAKSRYTYTEPTIERIAQVALNALEAARAQDVAAHEKNLPAIENNTAIAARVTALMDDIGMPKKWSERDRSSRARYPKNVTHDAGYITDLRRECKTEDGFAAATYTYERLKRDYEAYAATGKAEAERLAREAELAKQAEIDKRKADMELAAILLRYSLPIESSWSDVLESLRARDQRLDLAVAMSQTRGDWSEGCYRVEDAIGRFTIRNDEDKDIINDVLGCTRDFEDGRVFRDTAWSYSALFANVAATNKQLADDVQKAMERAGGSY
jgi:hypothetical protein